MQSASAGKISAAEPEQEREKLVSSVVVWADEGKALKVEVWADGNSESLADKEVIGTPAFHTEVCITGGRAAIDQSGTGSDASQLRI
jgi:hypothetical protein